MTIPNDLVYARCHGCGEAVGKRGESCQTCVSAYRPILIRKLITLALTLALATCCIIFYLWFGDAYPDGPEVLAGYEEICMEQYDRIVGCYTDFSSPVYERSRTGLGYPKWVETVDQYLILTWWIVGFCALYLWGYAASIVGVSVLFPIRQVFKLKKRRQIR